MHRSANINILKKCWVFTGYPYSYFNSIITTQFLGKNDGNEIIIEKPIISDSLYTL